MHIQCIIYVYINSPSTTNQNAVADPETRNDRRVVCLCFHIVYISYVKMHMLASVWFPKLLIGIVPEKDTTEAN